MHVQTTNVRTDVVEIAVRGNSVECNRSSSCFKAVRVADRRWAILSTNENNLDELIDKAKILASKGGEGVNLADAELAVGDFRFKRGYFDEESAMELLADLEKTLDSFVEAILTYERTFREVKTSDGADAREEKESIDLNVSVLNGGVASIQIGGIGGLEVIEDKFEFLIDELKGRINGLRKAKYLNPLMRGSKFDVILSKECACAFVHEIVHKLEADVSRTEIGEGCGITVYDNPMGFGGYHFDDEGVLAKEKCLIDDGKIISYLHTRESAFKYGEEPLGNGRGVFTIPKAFQTNLFVEKGDWKFDEMVEEMREGFVAEGLVKAEIQNDVITIYPEICWYVKNGEILCPAIVNQVRIPVRDALRRIKAVGKEYFERIGYEKGFAISEISPPIEIEAVVS